MSPSSLAETGYLVALRMDPNNTLAAGMLGRLYLDSGRHDDARRWISRSVLLGDTSARAYHSLAVSAYYMQDMQLALWAIDQAERQDEQSPVVIRAGALIRAASGQFGDAEDRLQRYKTVEPNPALQRNLVERVAQWRAALTDMREARGGEAASQAGPALLAQAAAAQPPGIPMPPALLQPAAALSSGPLAPNWSDCNPAGMPGSAYGAATNNSSSDETIQLPPLPSPCAGRPLPRMAVIDVVIVRSQDTRSTSKGINLLDSLSVTLAGNLLDYKRDWVTGGTNIGRTGQVNRDVTVALGAPGAGVTYSLNIANASDQANEVIARPSLLVLDRQPSTFFSGSTLSIALAGNLGGANRVDHPTGVSLSVTPTFIDNDSMLLAVKASRSAFQGTGLDLSQTVQSLRNAATANVNIRFNETLVLSGLAEQEIQENESGVPLLKDIPVLQYLFKNETTLNSNGSVLILLTPRRPEAPGENLGRQGLGEAAPPDVKELRDRAGKWLVATHNLDLVLANLDRKNLDSVGLFRQFRSGDLRAQVWHRPEHLQRILSDIASFLYY